LADDRANVVIFSEVGAVSSALTLGAQWLGVLNGLFAAGVVVGGFAAVGLDGRIKATTLLPSGVAVFCHALLQVVAV
jgi:hypothetical protein